MLIAAELFYNAHVVNDRFHVQQVYNEAVDEIRMTFADSSSQGKQPQQVRTAGNVLQRRDHAPDTGPQQTHSDDVAEQMD